MPYLFALLFLWIKAVLYNDSVDGEKFIVCCLANIYLVLGLTFIIILSIVISCVDQWYWDLEPQNFLLYLIRGIRTKCVFAVLISSSFLVIYFTAIIEDPPADPSVKWNWTILEWEIVEKEIKLVNDNVKMYLLANGRNFFKI